jgi:hypothetical protein
LASHDRARCLCWLGARARTAARFMTPATGRPATSLTSTRAGPSSSPTLRAPNGLISTTRVEDSRRAARLEHRGPVRPGESHGGAGGFLPSGVGWYRKHFWSVGPARRPARVRRIRRRHGQQRRVDKRRSSSAAGPTDTWASPTRSPPSLPADANILAVRVDDSGQPASRWYTGAGITDTCASWSGRPRPRSARRRRLSRCPRSRTGGRSSTCARRS